MPDAARKDSTWINDVESQHLCKRNGKFTKQSVFLRRSEEKPFPRGTSHSSYLWEWHVLQYEQRGTHPCKNGSQYERVGMMEWNTISEDTMNEIRDLIIEFLREAHNHADVHPFVKKVLGLYLNDGLYRLGLTQKFMMQWLECAMQEGLNHHLGLRLPIRGEGFDFTRSVVLLERLIRS